MRLNTHLNIAQKSLLMPLMDEIFEDADYFIANAEPTIDNFNEKVTHSTLSNERKEELYLFGALLLSLTDFIDDGG